MVAPKLSLNLRAATEEDIPNLVGLDHGYTTEYVWQMELDSAHPRMGASFREARLPRPMPVIYPRPKETLLENWNNRSALLIAEAAGQPVGYASLSTELAPKAAWLTDLVVGASHRRKGVGTRLVLAAQAWAREKSLPRLVLEMQSKNYPAIKLAQKMAFEFSGYHDRYYDNQDIALFFAKNLM